MSWLGDILARGRALKLAELKAACDWDLPENPTLSQLRAKARELGQMAKEQQNLTHRWSDAQWRELSKAIEKLEKK